MSPIFPPMSEELEPDTRREDIKKLAAAEEKAAQARFKADRALRKVLNALGTVILDNEDKEPVVHSVAVIKAEHAIDIAKANYKQADRLYQLAHNQLTHALMRLEEAAQCKSGSDGLGGWR